MTIHFFLAFSTSHLWQLASKLGVGRAISDTGKVIVVAKYRPTNVFKTTVKTVEGKFFKRLSIIRAVYEMLCPSEGTTMDRH